MLYALFCKEVDLLIAARTDRTLLDNMRSVDKSAAACIATLFYDVLAHIIIICIIIKKAVGLDN